jgi:HlyD family secretion protein
VEVLSAKYAVRRAELEVQRNELLADIDAKKNELNLKEAKQRLKQLESDIKSRLEQAQAELAVLKEKKNKSNLELSRERQRLSQVKLLAPISGLVAMRQNRTGFMFPGMQVPDIREGDQIQPGIPVADVLDLSEMEVVAKVGELDRANLKERQQATLVLDALPDKRLHGSIKSMSGTATSNAFSFDPAKKFDVVFAIDMKELLGALGAKPEAIQKILATADANRRKPAGTAPNPFMMGGAPPAGGGNAMIMQAPGGPAPGGPAPANAMQMPAGPAGNGGMRNGPATIQRGPGGNAPQAPGAGDQKMQAPDGPKMMQFVRGPGMGPRMGGASQFSEKDLANAKLPPPPEEDTQFDVLLRPGLLADVEIIVEKVPNALNVPMQAVFEHEGKPVVYVRKGSLWEPRVIKPLKRSESTMVIAEGVAPGETIALADPTAKKSDKKKQDKGGGAMSALPGGSK